MRLECVSLDGIDVALLNPPKVAATSCRAALLAAHGEGLEEGKQVHHHPALVRTTDRQHIAAFVRHPLDRLVSCWADRVRGSGPKVPSEPMQRLGYHRGMGFSGFVRHLALVGTESDPHTRLQASFLYRGPRWLPSFLGRFERLEEDWGRLAAWFDLGELPHHQQSERGPWEEHYDGASEAVARRLYAPDLELLGYA